jgi:hypothetical protein
MEFEKFSNGSSDLIGLLELVYCTSIRSLLCKSLSHVAFFLLTEARNNFVCRNSINDFHLSAINHMYLHVDQDTGVMVT